MFVTIHTWTAISIPTESIDVSDHIASICNPEWTKWYSMLKNCVDSNYMLNTVEEQINYDLFIIENKFYSTTEENALNLQRTLIDSGWVDFWKNNGYDVTLSAPVEVDFDANLSDPNTAWINELISDQPNSMWNIQYPVQNI
jgi:hypothetical protein